MAAAAAAAALFRGTSSGLHHPIESRDWLLKRTLLLTSFKVAHEQQAG
jgi:hypothetical protein